MRIVDILDITIIAFFLYIVLNWLRQSGSRRSIISFFVLLTVYVLARFTGMYLTELLIEGLFVVILIGLVIVFQSDMRRLIDQIASWSIFDNGKSRGSSNVATSIITEACAKMAEQRMGALIAIKGKEDWERHIHGGIELNGKVTIPLLHSIFNTKAPGHDGAVLLEGDRIQKFGVHLPLSTNLYKMSRGGTRHTAALGLSEKCDALIVVVSEERGTISIARDGQIEALDSNSDLQRHLDDFWKTNYPTASPSITQWWRRRSLRTALAAAALSIILWIALAYPSGTVYRTYELPIEYRNLESTQIALQDSVPLRARVTLSGPEQAFRTLDPSNLVVSFNLAEQDISDGELEIDEDHINLPPDLNFFESSPRMLKLKPRQYVRVQKPVKVPTMGRLRPGLELISITAVPPQIEVLSDTSRSTIDSVMTEPVDLSKIQNSTVIQKRINPDREDYRLPESTSQLVRIEVTVRRSSQQ